MVGSYGNITLTLILHSGIVQGVILLIVTYCQSEDSNSSKRKVHAWIGSAIPCGYACQLLHRKLVPSCPGTTTILARKMLRVGKGERVSKQQLNREKFHSRDAA